MKINRSKRIQKTLSFYCNNFGFRKPYQVLIDGTFCFVALKDQLDIQVQLKIYLGEDIKLLTTPCVVLETEKLGSSVFGAMLIVKKFPVHKCGHNSKPLSGSDCMLSMIGSSNPNRYIIATQDRDLQNVLRTIPAVPLLYFHSKALTLEPPTKLCREVAEKATASLCSVSKYEEATLTKLNEVELGIKPNSEPVPKKRKKGGPNPLSCKEKKKQNTACTSTHLEETSCVIKKKKNRRSKKIPQHVKEELKLLKPV